MRTAEDGCECCRVGQLIHGPKDQAPFQGYPSRTFETYRHQAGPVVGIADGIETNAQLKVLVNQLLRKLGDY